MRGLLAALATSAFAIAPGHLPENMAVALAQAGFPRAKWASTCTISRVTAKCCLSARTGQLNMKLLTPSQRSNFSGPHIRKTEVLAGWGALGLPPRWQSGVFNVGADALVINYNTFRLQFMPGSKTQTVDVFSEPDLPQLLVINISRLGTGNCDVWPKSVAIRSRFPACPRRGAAGSFAMAACSRPTTTLRRQATLRAYAPSRLHPRCARADAGRGPDQPRGCAQRTTRARRIAGVGLPARLYGSTPLQAMSLSAATLPGLVR